VALIGKTAWIVPSEVWTTFHNVLRGFSLRKSAPIWRLESTQTSSLKTGTPHHMMRHYISIIGQPPKKSTISWAYEQQASAHCPKHPITDGQRSISWGTFSAALKYDEMGAAWSKTIGDPFISIRVSFPHPLGLHMSVSHHPKSVFFGWIRGTFCWTLGCSLSPTSTRVRNLSCALSRVSRSHWFMRRSVISAHSQTKNIVG